MLTLTPQSLRRALDHALIVGDTDLFPVPFEFSAINAHWDEIAGALAKANTMDWTARPYRRCLTPKHHFGFRVATQLDPLDFLVFTALVIEVGGKLEARRVPVEQQIVFANRFHASPKAPSLFNLEIGYADFLTRSKDLASKCSWVLVADIADFFARLYLHRLENALNAAGTGNHGKAIMNLLSQWSGSYSYGIPVGPGASRLLAEVAIADVDQAMLAERAAFVRYSDDYRVFCSSKREAYDRLASLANCTGPQFAGEVVQLWCRESERCASRGRCPRAPGVCSPARKEMETGKRRPVWGHGALASVARSWRFASCRSQVFSVARIEFAVPIPVPARVYECGNGNG